MIPFLKINIYVCVCVCFRFQIYNPSYNKPKYGRGRNIKICGKMGIGQDEQEVKKADLICNCFNLRRFWHRHDYENNK